MLLTLIGFEEADATEPTGTLGPARCERRSKGKYEMTEVVPASCSLCRTSRTYWYESSSLLRPSRAPSPHISIHRLGSCASGCHKPLGFFLATICATDGQLLATLCSMLKSVGVNQQHRCQALLNSALRGCLSVSTSSGQRPLQGRSACPFAGDASFPPNRSCSSGPM